MPASHERAADPQHPVAGAPGAGRAPAIDLAAALGGLDRAARNFSRRLGESPDRGDAAPDRQGRGVPSRSNPPTAGGREAGPADDPFDSRLREAEREAREYLEHAKRRADALVTTMVGAVEKEAADIRREAEEGIRARWRQVEFEAGRHLDDARRVGDSMVAERQQRIAVLSDTITGRAEALSAGLGDADRVRKQFEAFARALSATADRVATDQRARSPAPIGANEVHDLHPHARPSALAA